MGAPKGNRFWELRSKHGRDKIFATAEIMKQACYSYFEYQNEQKWNKVDFKGKEVERVEIPVSSPFTLSGLCIFLGVNTKYFTEFEKTCDKDFSEVITHVRDVIYTQKFEGATVGAYNASIIARDLELKDQSVNTNIDLSMSEDERLNKIAELTNKLNKNKL